MQGAGNDFAVIDATRQPLCLETETIRKLAHRNFGIGFDQLLVIEPARTSNFVRPLLSVSRSIEIGAVSMGNPHAVQLVADVEAAPVRTEGPLIEMHPRFPQRVNAGYMQIEDRRRIRLRVFERGSGETLACGTGACAAVAVGIARGLLDSPVAVEARGGTLTVSWAGGDNAVWMKGPARSVFAGEIEI